MKTICALMLTAALGAVGCTTTGKSITGGHVYRGKKFPELAGCYLYADYVSGKVWALKYDEKAKKVVANYSISGNIMPIMSFVRWEIPLALR